MKKDSAEQPAQEAAARSASSRLSLPLNSDGTINWGKVRPSMREAFGQLVANDPTALEMIGLAASGDDDTATDKPEEVEEESLLGDLTEETAGQLLDLLARSTAIGFNFFISKTRKHPFFVNERTKKPIPLMIEPQFLFPAFSLSSEDHANLDPKALKEMKKRSKHMPEWVKNNLNLIMLMSGFFQAVGKSGVKALQDQIKHDVGKMQSAAIATPKNPKPDSDAIPPSPSEPIAPFPGRVTNISEMSHP